MEQERFNELVARVPRLGQGKGRALRAVALHLVNGVELPAAADRAGVSFSAAWACLQRIPRETCQCCGQPLPQDQATIKKSARRKRAGSA